MPLPPPPLPLPHRPSPGGLGGILDTIIVVQYSMSRTFVILGRMGLVPPALVRAAPMH